MKQKCVTIFYWLLLIMWSVVIFYFSAQNGVVSSEISEGITQSVIQTNNFEVANTVETVIRKLAHVFEYCILSILLCRCFNFLGSFKKWRSFRYSYLVSFCLSVGYAFTDEFHQLFVGGRSGNFVDIGIDTIGIILGILIVFLVSIIIEKRKQSC